MLHIDVLCFEKGIPLCLNITRFTCAILSIGELLSSLKRKQEPGLNLPRILHAAVGRRHFQGH
jgi:hypothetical protein